AFAGSWIKLTRRLWDWPEARIGQPRRAMQSRAGSVNRKKADVLRAKPFVALRPNSDIGHSAQPDRAVSPEFPRRLCNPPAAHLPKLVNCAPSSATKMASRLAGSVALAFSLTRCSLPGGSKKLSPAL